MRFGELEFKTHPLMPGGRQARFKFENGYGASVVCSSTSYGGDEGLYELAVTTEDGLCYDTPITADVLGWLSESDVEESLAEIKALPPYKRVAAK